MNISTDFIIIGAAVAVSTSSFPKVIMYLVENLDHRRRKMSEQFVMKAVVSIVILGLGVLVLWANQTGEKNED